MGLSHIEIVRDQFPQHQIAAVADPHGPSLDAAKKAAPNAVAFTDPDALIACDIDAIILSTPGFTHADLAERCIRAGKHLFAEKPVMTTRDGCRRMLELAERDDRVIAINHELRYSNYFGKMKQLIAAGEIGEPQLCWCKEFRLPFLKKVGDWIQDSRYSGGCLVDKNCHHFDLLNWYVDSKPKKVCGFGGNDVVHVVNNEHEVVDHAAVSFEYANGVRGSLVLCMFAPRAAEHLELGVIGTDAIIQTRIARDEILIYRHKAETNAPIVHHLPDRKVGWGAHNGFIEAHDAFFRAVEKGERALTDVRDCVDGTLLAIAAEEAIKSGKVVEV
jgi:predicted dehydrogenase